MTNPITPLQSAGYVGVNTPEGQAIAAEINALPAEEAVTEGVNMVFVNYNGWVPVGQAVSQISRGMLANAEMDIMTGSESELDAETLTGNYVDPTEIAETNATTQAAGGYSHSSAPGMSTADQIAAAVANTGGTEDPTLLATAITEGYAATPAQESDAIKAAKAIAAIPTAGEDAAEIANNQDAADYALGILDAAVNSIAAAATGVGNTLLGTVANNSSVNTNTANNNPSSTGGSTPSTGLISTVESGAGSVVTWLEGYSSYIIAGAAGIILIYLIAGVLRSGSRSGTPSRRYVEI